MFTARYRLGVQFNLKSFSDRVMDVAVNRPPLTAKRGFDPSSVHVRFALDKVAPRHISL